MMGGNGYRMSGWARVMQLLHVTWTRDIKIEFLPARARVSSVNIDIVCQGPGVSFFTGIRR